MFSTFQINLAPDSRDSKDVSFLPNLFVLASGQYKNLEKGLKEKIAVALTRHHYHQFPFCIGCIFERKNDVADVVVITHEGEFNIYKINLATGEEISTPENVDELVNTDNLQIEYSETATAPYFLNATVKKSFDEYISTLIHQDRQQQEKDFLEGKTFMPYAPEDPPKKPDYIKDCSFSDIVKIFPGLKALEDLHQTSIRVNQETHNLNIEFNTLLQEAAKIDGKLIDWAIEEFANLQLDKIIETSSRKLSAVEALVFQAKDEFAPYYINYINTNQHIYFLKLYLAHALQNGFGSYYNLLQQQTQNKPEERARGVDSFNNHFHEYTVIENNRLRDKEFLEKFICEQNLDEIKQGLDTLIGTECKTSLIGSSDKQIELQRNINDAAKKLDAKTPPFSVSGVSIFGLSTMHFVWSAGVLASLDKLKDDKLAVEKTLASPAYDLKTLNFEDEQQQLAAFQNKFTNFKVRVEFQKLLLQTQAASRQFQQQIAADINPVDHNMDEDYLNRVETEMVRKISAIGAWQHAEQEKLDQSINAIKADIKNMRELIQQIEKQDARLNKIKITDTHPKPVKPVAHGPRKRIIEFSQPDTPSQPLENAVDQKEGKKTKGKASSLDDVISIRDNQKEAFAKLQAHHEALNEKIRKTREAHAELEKQASIRAMQDSAAKLQTTVQACNKQIGDFLREQLEKEAQAKAQERRAPASPIAVRPELETQTNQAAHNEENFGQTPPPAEEVRDHAAINNNQDEKSKAHEENKRPKFPWKEIAIGAGIGFGVTVVVFVLVLIFWPCVLAATVGTAAGWGLGLIGAKVGATTASVVGCATVAAANTATGAAAGATAGVLSHTCQGPRPGKTYKDIELGEFDNHNGFDDDDDPGADEGPDNIVPPNSPVGRTTGRVNTVLQENATSNVVNLQGQAATTERIPIVTIPQDSNASSKLSASPRPWENRSVSPVNGDVQSSLSTKNGLNM